MRFDKLTTKFQQALADAQSIAVGQDRSYVEPQYLLLALLQQEDGGTISLLQRSGANVPPLRDALKKAIERLPRWRVPAEKSTPRASWAICSTLRTRKHKNAVINSSHRRCSCSPCFRTKAKPATC